MKSIRLLKDIILDSLIEIIFNSSKNNFNESYLVNGEYRELSMNSQQKLNNETNNYKNINLAITACEKFADSNPSINERLWNEFKTNLLSSQFEGIRFLDQYSLIR